MLIKHRVRTIGLEMILDLLVLFVFFSSGMQENNIYNPHKKKRSSKIFPLRSPFTVNMLIAIKYLRISGQILIKPQMLHR